jgi:hypothetical protein
MIQRVVMVHLTCIGISAMKRLLDSSKALSVATSPLTTILITIPSAQLVLIN